MMNIGKFKQWLFFGSFTLGALILDQVSKGWARSQEWVHVQQNTGIALGIQLPSFLQTVGSILILFLLLWVGVVDLFSSREHPFLNPILLGVIVGGAAGNLVDRWLMGSVTDFILLAPFPVFNVADVCITVGLVLLLYANRSTLRVKS
ncbi:signal peptidase II [Candidatus Peregrinibacteria bacterium]|nr:MAG: signal peptidase II [Candidatus Peregrinibacteria bacterium]